MKAELEISNSLIEKVIKEIVDKSLSEKRLEEIIESKISQRTIDALKRTISDQKIENYCRDRISRIITVESLKEFTSSLDSSDVLSNVEEKILLMIKNSKDFKLLVRSTIKSCL